MKKIFCVLFFAVIFSGCFDVYIYLIPLKDNSYIVSQRLSFGLDVLKAFNSLRSMDSTGQSTQKETLTPQQMMDSIMMSAKNDTAYTMLPGYLGHSLRDSLFDTTAFFITDIHVKTADDVAAFIKAAQSDKSSPSDLSIGLAVSHPNGMTKFEFTAKKNEAPPENNSMLDISKFETGGFHVGMLSENYQSPQAKTLLKPIPGGSEWFIPFKSLKNWKKVKTKKVEFIVAH